MLYPIFLCAFSSLFTAVGGLIIISLKKISDRTMAISQAFAGGVMVAVSLVDMLPHAYKNSLKYLTAQQALMGVVGLFLSGWIIGALLTGLVVPDYKGEDKKQFTAKRLMMITTAVVVLHNLPEGMLTIFSGIDNPKFGLTMAIAIALHNLPEGMAIAAPVLYVTKSRTRAVLQSLMAGLCELFGGIIALWLFKEYISESFINGLLPIIAGIMCQTAVCELIPSSARLTDYKDAVIGTIIGIILMTLGIFTI